MSTDQTKLIYIVTAPRLSQSTPALTNSLSALQIKTINYERGEIDSADARLAEDMRVEWIRQQTFASFPGWKHTRGLGLMLSKFGFFSKLDNSSASTIFYTLCKGRFIFKESNETNKTQDSSPNDNELSALHLLLRQHQVLNSTCPRSLGLEGDNIPVTRPPIQNMKNWKDLPQNQESLEDTADDEYCNEESELRLQKLLDTLEPPYTNDLFAEMLPYIGPLIFKRTAREWSAASFQGKKIFFNFTL